MMELVYNEVGMQRVIAALETHQRLAFGAACCERSLPNYLAFSKEVGWGSMAPLRKALEITWLACEGMHPPDELVREVLVGCEAVIPESEDFESLYTSSALDAAVSVCGLLDFLLTGDSDHVVSAARHSTDSIDLIVQERASMDPQDPDLEYKILVHPLMQQELRRQQRDLEDVSKLRQGPGAFSFLKTRAQSEEAFTLAK